ncbi:unnamed protein product [Candidula unifasciata]|uniref:Uncharacterized protein n=1 Tax=Candidula unifasciata TaxID=100452 RepID=A0A8S3ZCE4_9EUPU|nr:unnamed protein product [Candidula unifasciata]
MYLNIVQSAWSHSAAKGKRSNFSIISRFAIQRLANVLIHFSLLTLSPGRASRESMMQDLQTLATLLPGCYSNVEQYYKHVKRGLPPEKRHFMLKAEIYKMANPMFNDSVTFYFQDFTRSTSEPFRSGFYSFSAETKMNIVKMKTFQLKNNAFIANAFQKSWNFTLGSDVTAEVISSLGLDNGGLRTYGACDMFWKRMGDNTFIGITGPLCLGTLGTDQVRIGVSMTLTPDKLLLTDSWYKLTDGTQITELKVPYILQKLALPSKPGAMTEKSTTSLQDQMSNDIDTPTETKQSLQQNNPRHENSYKPLRSKTDKTYKPGKQKRSHSEKRTTQHRILRNFQQVAAALTSGHDVYFRVELSACTIPQQVKVDRLSFGGMIKNFVFVRQDGYRNGRKDYIYFLSHKTVMGNQGPEFISRQLTLLREGRVKVEITKRFSEPTKVKQGYAFECKLYDDQKGYGGVKLALDPTSHIQTINSFHNLASSVGHGRDLHIVADLARCQGSRKRPAVVMGSQITNYDFVNNGKTVEIFIPFVQMMTSTSDETKTSVQGFMGQILKNSDVILTLITNSQSTNSLDNVFNLSSAYQCTLSNRNEVLTNDVNEHSVKLFYSK